MPVVDRPATVNREPVRNASVQCHKSRSDYRQPVSIFWPRGHYWHRRSSIPPANPIEYRKKQDWRDRRFPHAARQTEYAANRSRDLYYRVPTGSALNRRSAHLPGAASDACCYAKHVPTPRSDAGWQAQYGNDSKFAVGKIPPLIAPSLTKYCAT